MAWPKNGECNLYTDLMEEFQEKGHQVTVVALNEKANKQKTNLTIYNNIQIIRVKTGNIQKRNKYSKVIFSFLAGPQILCAIHKYLKGCQYELILFSTPPITLSPCIILLKKRYQAKLYLLLKDIWPQDAVDLGAMIMGGIVWKVFRYLEKKTYKNCDYIGCMSPANVEYIIKNNKYLQEKKVEVCPNSLKKRDFIEVDRGIIREKYGLPKDKIIFIYGGNFGKAQGVEFLVTMIHAYQHNPDLYFLMIGAGTEYDYLKNKINSLTFDNAKMVPWIPRTEFADLVQACDVGLILLNKNSTVPNFPSRFLTYLSAKIPIIAAVDKVTDIGDIIENASCGWKVNHGDVDSFKSAVEKVMISKEDRKKMGENGFQLFREKYTTNQTYEIIIRHFLEGETDFV